MIKKYKDKKVFISGGSGVIGSELVDILYNEGAIIFVGDLKPKPSHWPSDILYRQGDLNYITKEEIEEFQPEIFFHLAATFERTIETYEFWDENFHHNIKLSHHLMTIFKSLNSLKKVVFASSYLIYDPSLYLFNKPKKEPVKLKETHPISPRNLTGMAKLAHEIELNFLKKFHNQHFKTIIARIFRGYGKNSRDVISRWIRALINNETIYLYRKENMFDFIYARDSAMALALLGLSDFEGIINVGSGKSYKIEEVINILKKFFLQVKVQEIEENIPYEASQADISLLKKVTKWKPIFSLQDGIKEIIDYEIKRNGKYLEDNINAGNVLITSISKKVPLIENVRLAAKKISQSIKIIGADSNDNCIAKYFVDSFWHMPPLENLKVNQIIDFCKKFNINAIIPTRNEELKYWSEHKNIFLQNNINVMVSNINTVKICTDKLLFYKELFNKYPVIFTTDNLDEIKHQKLIIKERYGSGSRLIYINIDYEKAKELSKNLSNPIFQPFIEGKEISIDVYITKNNICKGVVLRERNLIVSGESHITTTFKNKEIEDLFLKLSIELNIYGHAVFQAIIDKNNNIHIIECNCRFGGASTIAIKAGLDSFYWFLLESNNVNVDNYFSKIKEVKLLQVRYNKDKIFYL